MKFIRFKTKYLVIIVRQIKKKIILRFISILRIFFYELTKIVLIKLKINFPLIKIYTA